MHYKFINVITESLTTHIASVWFLSSMRWHVYYKFIIITEGLVTNFTSIRFLSSMRRYAYNKIIFITENIVRKILILDMVSLQYEVVYVLSEWIVTNVTSIRFFSSMGWRSFLFRKALSEEINLYGYFSHMK